MQREGAVGLRAYGVGQVEDGRLRSVVPLEPDDRAIAVCRRQLGQMTGIGATESVDGLGLVADDGQSGAPGRQMAHDVDLQGVDVLVFVDQDEGITVRQVAAEIRMAEQGPPVKEEVVEVQQHRSPLTAGEIAEQGGDRFQVRLDPRVAGRDELAKWALVVDAARVNVDQRGRPWKPLGRARETVVVAEEIHEIAGAGGVEHAGRLRQIEHLGVGDDVLVGNGMKGPAVRAPMAV